MTLPSSGPIYMSQVNSELSRPSNQGISLNDGQVRTLAGHPSGYIDMYSLLGKSWALSYNLTVGSVVGKASGNYGFGSGLPGSSINPTGALGGGTITGLSWVSSSTVISLAISGGPGNTGWNNINVNGQNFARSAGTFTAPGSWMWNTGTNPFGTTNGAVIPVVMS